MKKTKIIATIGPASNNEETIKKLILNGMNIARLNFSHGSLAEHSDTINKIRRIAKKCNQPIAILQDLPGPKIRIGEMPKEGVNLISGDKFILTTILQTGNKEIAYVNYSELTQDVKKNDQILLADGNIELSVDYVEDKNVHCLVISGGKLTSNKGVNIPSENLQLESFTKHDQELLKFGIEKDVDFVALSFVKSEKDILRAKKMILEANKKIMLVAKIERQAALQNIEKIIHSADAIMIARGDLGVEIPLEKVPVIQKDLIEKSNFHSKPVITATQMLGSMVSSTRPTRAESSDVANAILDGTDAIMLSEETAIGINPEKAVLFMNRIAQNAEQRFPYAYHLHQKPKKNKIACSVAHAACLLADELKAKVIVAYTLSGTTARFISHFRPETMILALTPHQGTCRKLALCWNVFPKLIDNQNDTDKMLEYTRKILLEEDFIEIDDIAVITAGVPMMKEGRTNLIRVMRL